jgi:hypothetical protein
MKTDDFTPLTLATGPLLDLSADAFPTRVFGWNDDTLALPADATHFGLVVNGGAILHDGQDRFRLRAGMFFVWPRPCVRRAAVGSSFRASVIKGCVK